MTSLNQILIKNTEPEDSARDWYSKMNIEGTYICNYSLNAVVECFIKGKYDSSIMIGLTYCINGLI